MSDSFMKDLGAQILALDDDIALVAVIDNQNKTLFSKRKSERDIIFTVDDEARMILESKILFETLTDIDPNAGEIRFMMIQREKNKGMFFFIASFTIAIRCQVTTDSKKMTEISYNIEKNILLNIFKKMGNQTIYIDSTK